MPKLHGWWAFRNNDRIAFQMILPTQAGNSIGTRGNLAVIIGKTDHGKFARLKPEAWWAVSLRRKQLVGLMHNRSYSA